MGPGMACPTLFLHYYPHPQPSHPVGCNHPTHLPTWRAEKILPPPLPTSSSLYITLSALTVWLELPHHISFLARAQLPLCTGTPTFPASLILKIMLRLLRDTPVCLLPPGMRHAAACMRQATTCASDPKRHGGEKRRGSPSSGFPSLLPAARDTHHACYTPPPPCTSDLPPNLGAGVACAMMILIMCGWRRSLTGGGTGPGGDTHTGVLRFGLRRMEGGWQVAWHSVSHLPASLCVYVYVYVCNNVYNICITHTPASFHHACPCCCCHHRHPTFPTTATTTTPTTAPFLREPLCARRHFHSAALLLFFLTMEQTQEPTPVIDLPCWFLPCCGTFYHPRNLGMQPLPQPPLGGTTPSNLPTHCLADLPCFPLPLPPLCTPVIPYMVRSLL